ncbi:MAG TPA: sialate O-acetylesterase [Candidatus Paceibacterota bacterium]|nr:sialate O-acetylesterase [Candidatus Paceibacterota bacterium]
MKGSKFLMFMFTTCFLMSGCSSNNHDTNLLTEDTITSNEEEQDNFAQVIVLLGQSNMEGHTQSRFLTNTMPDKASEYAAGYEDVKISFVNSGGYTSNNEFVSVNLGQGLSTNHFGPEIGIAETMHNANKRNVFLIKYAHGSTSLSGHWISPSSNLGRSGSMYRGAVNFILSCMDQLENMGYYPEIKAICWMQGEDDSNGNQYDSYYNYTKNFVKDLREDLKLYMDLEGIAFLDAAIAALDHVWTKHEIINNAKRQNAEEDALSFFIDTNNEGLKTNHEPVGAVDIYHYDSSSMIKLGRLFGNILIQYFID